MTEKVHRNDKRGKKEEEERRGKKRKGGKRRIMMTEMVIIQTGSKICEQAISGDDKINAK